MGRARRGRSDEGIAIRRLAGTGGGRGRYASVSSGGNAFWSFGRERTIRPVAWRREFGRCTERGAVALRRLGQAARTWQVGNANGFDPGQGRLRRGRRGIARAEHTEPVASFLEITRLGGTGKFRSGQFGRNGRRIERQRSERSRVERGRMRHVTRTTCQGGRRGTIGGFGSRLDIGGRHGRHGIAGSVVGLREQRWIESPGRFAIERWALRFRCVRCAARGDVIEPRGAGWETV